MRGRVIELKLDSSFNDVIKKFAQLSLGRVESGHAAARAVARPPTLWIACRIAIRDLERYSASELAPRSKRRARLNRGILAATNDDVKLSRNSKTWRVLDSESTGRDVSRRLRTRPGRVGARRSVANNFRAVLLIPLGRRA